MDGGRDGESDALERRDPKEPSGEPLVGRGLELEALSDALTEARTGRGRCVMLVGEAGVGKTTLARAVAHEATVRGFGVAWGRCWEGGGAPAFWPWIQVVRAVAEDLGRDEVVRLAGAGAGYLAQIVPEIALSDDRTARLLRSTEHDRFQMFDAAAAFLKALSQDRPMLVVFDDLHAADDSSLHLLRFLARETYRSAVMVVGTYVESDLSLDPVRSRLLHAISREGHILRIRGLDKDGVATLYRKATGEQPPEPILTAVHDATEGNPFFVDEAIRLLESRGDLRRADFSLGFRVPKGARDVLDRRLALLPDDTIWVLTIAAVIGREFDIGTLREVSQIDSTALVDVLRSAAKSEVIQEIGSQGHYAFSHILLREVLYEELTAGDRMRLHNEVAQVLEQRSQGDLKHLGQLAHHYFKAAQAGDKKKAVDYALRAGDQASQGMAYEEAVRLYRRALRVAETAGAGRARREEIMRRLNEAEARVGGDVVSEDGPTILAEIRGVFSQQGDFWEIEFEGRKFRLRDSKGLRYLSHLLRNPGQEVHSLEVVGLLEGRPALHRSPTAADAGLHISDFGDAGEVLDRQAKTAYKRRIHELRQEIEEADSFNDPERAARAQDEMDTLLEQLSAAVGLGGRDRRAGSPAERARLSVTKAVKGALAKIRTNHPALGAHLDATVRTGMFCVYLPDPRVPIRWEF